MNLSIRSRFFVLLFVIVSYAGYSQSCLTISAGSNTTVCSGACANLSAVLSQSVRATTAYTVSSIAHSPLPYTGGTNAFAFATDDIWSQPINIGFNFCYFGNTFTQCLVGSNGQITFNTALAGQPNTFTITTAIPSTVNVPGNTICGPFRDIDPSQGGVVRTYVTGTAPCRRFVAYWSGVPHWGGGCAGVPTTTFQIVLNETTNDIQVFINNHTACNANSGGAGIVGVQNNNGTIATAAPARNFPGAWTAINEGWLFRPNGASATAITWSGPSGVVGTGLTATVCPTSTSTYTSSMVVTQCNGATNTFTSTVQVSVTPVPTITAGSSTTTVCSGNAVSLNASGANTYTWNPGNITGGTVTVNPTVTTTYTVVGTGVGSCTNSAQVTVTVLPGPALVIGNTSPSVCAGSSSTLSASGGVTYTWQPVGSNASSVIVTPVATTVYTLSGTDLAGCTSSVTSTVTVVSPPVVGINVNPNPLCSGSSATLTASGASSYTWSTGATGTAIVVSPTVTSVFTATGSSGGGCTATASTTVTVLPLFPVVINPSSATVCPNTPVNLFASAAAINYTWLPVNLFTPTITVTPTATTIYTVIASNGTCTNSATSTITTLSAPVLNPVASPTAVCSGNSSTLTAGGALTYTWIPGGFNTASVSVTPTVTTTYSVSGTNALGCVSTETVDVIVNTNPVISTAGTSTAICVGGTATLNASGANSYTWNPGNIPLSSVVVSPGTTTTYTVTGETNGCIGTETVTVNVNPTPTVNTSASSSTICLGATTTLSATGALSYTWSPGAFTGSTVAVNPTVTTIYTVTGENGANCSTIATLTITVNPLPVISATGAPTALCSSGNVTLSASGASTYTWNPGNLTGSTVTSSISATTSFTVSGTAPSGCTNTAIVTVTVDTPPVISANPSPSAICLGGSSTLTATGSSGFTWTPGGLTGTTVVVTPTISTIYTVVAVNGACTSSVTVPVTVNALPVLAASSSPTSICSGNSATLSATGATSYTWNPGSLIGASVAVTPANSTIYSVTGTNGSGCTSSTTVALFVQSTPTVLASASPTAICPGNSTTLTAIGAPSFTWNPGGLTGSSIVVSPTVSTTYTVTGANGVCATTSTLNVLVNPQPVILASVSPTAICNGATATLSANGATTYTWVPGTLNGASVTVSPTVSTLYTVTGTSSLGCTGNSTVNLVVNSNPVILASASPTSICSGASTTLSATGAASYTWSPGGLNGASVTATPSTSTVFSVVATSSLGCTGNGTVAVFVTPTPSINATASPTPVCAGNSVTLTAVGATSFTWNPGGINSAVAVVTPSSTINYTVTGANGVCTRTVSVPVFVVPNPNVSALASPSVICEGNTTTLTASGALTYTWLPGTQNGSVITTSLSTSSVFTVSGTNVNGCIGTNTVAVTVNALPVLTVTAAPANSICAGSNVTLTASGAASYTWQPLGLTNATVTDTPSGTQTYTVNGESAAGCVKTETLTITVVPLPSLTISPSSSTVCSGSPVTLTATGATAYTWTPGASTGSVLTDNPTATTIYTLTGEDGGCESVQTITITVDPNPTVTAVASSTDICSGSSVTLTASGAGTYTWTPGSISGTSVVVTPTVTTSYSLQGTSTAGCISNVDVVTVSVTPLPSVTIAATATAVCAGTSVSLTASGATSYTWLPGGNTATLEVVTPTVTSSYTLVGENGLCSNQSVITLSVQPSASVTIASSSGTAAVCANTTVTLTAGGTSTYTWNPGGVTATTLAVTPSVTTTYTVTGDNGTGCTGSAFTTVTVTPAPSLTITAPSLTICADASTTLNVSGATSYTWIPFGITVSSLPVSPTVTTTYSVIGSNGTCTTLATETVVVNALPVLTVAATPSLICGGNSSTLAVSGAQTYTWQPLGINGSSVVVTPTATTLYTVSGTDANGCAGSGTIQVSTGTAPVVTASNDGPISCSLAAVSLSATTSATNINFSWSGPGSYTSSVQSPTGIAVPGDYTVTVTDITSGCTGTAVTTVTIDPSVPQLTVTTSGSLTCNTLTVSLSAVTNVTNAAFSWNGPGSFTASTASITVSAAGAYSLTVTNLDNSCRASTVITVGGYTAIPVSGTITPASCSGTVANNDASIQLSGFSPSDRYDLVAGTSYTGAVTYTSATTIPLGGVITNTLANPSTTVAYTVRVFDSNGCTADITFTLTPTYCLPPNLEFGLAKAVSTPSLQANGTYNVTYSVVAQNATSGVLNNVVLLEPLSTTFPAPSTFSIIAPPVLTNTNSGLSLNPAFDGSVQVALTLPTSSMSAISKDTIVFQLNIIPNGVFGPFNNSVTGSVLSGTNTIRDTSQTGMIPDSDSDFDFSDNNQPTVLLLDPFRFFGITKEGSVSERLTDGTYDVTYTITVHNKGNDTLRNVTVKDSLYQTTVKIPANYSVKNGPLTSGFLISNPAFNGRSDINLILPGSSKIAPFSTERIVFTINVVPDTVTIYRNSAYGSALGTGSIAVSDTSNTGNNPDTNSNGIWNEAVDNQPTVLVIKPNDLFIPQAFTPEGDGKNDFFVIKGLKSNTDNNLTVYNRWGNKVYEKPNYDNTWDGTPNVSGTLGGQKLPQGTYYYIFEIKDGTKPVTGFVVIQY